MRHIKRELRRDVLPHALLKLPGAHTWYVRKKFGVELALLRGEHQTENSQRSIIHFSVNKAATQYVKSILRRCVQESGMTHVQMNEYALDSEFPYLDQLSAPEMQIYRHIFKPFGYLYSVFGGMVEGIPDLQDYLIILVMRDPRDILTSDYFSMRFSHRQPRSRTKLESFRAERQLARNGAIDAYVLRESLRLRGTCQRYIDLLVERPNVRVFAYEDMIADFPMWLEDLLGHCQLSINSQLARELVDEARVSRRMAEDPSRHMRQVAPGDHKKKLRGETIAKLNASFSEILKRFKYE